MKLANSAVWLPPSRRHFQANPGPFQLAHIPIQAQEGPAALPSLEPPMPLATVPTRQCAVVPPAKPAAAQVPGTPSMVVCDTGNRCRQSLCRPCVISVLYSCTGFYPPLSFHLVSTWSTVAMATATAVTPLRQKEAGRLWPIYPPGNCASTAMWQRCAPCTLACCPRCWHMPTSSSKPSFSSMGTTG